MSQKLTYEQAGMNRVFSDFGFSKPQLARENSIHVDTVRNILKNKSVPEKEL